jgi:hypothetical protein
MASVVRRVRPAPVVEEPEKIPVKTVDDDEQGSTAGSGRTDYDAVCDRFRKSATNRKSAIRAMCVICMGGMVYEVAKCTSTSCPLYQFRMGENPNDARTIAAKAKKEAEAAAQELAKAAAKAKPAARTVRRTRG